VPTDKRQRKREGHQARASAAAEARRRKQTRRSRGIAGAFLALVLVAGLAVVINGGGSSDQTVNTGDTSTTTAAAAGTTKKAVALTPVPPGASLTGDTPCPPKDGTAPRTTTFAKPPPLCVSVATTYTADMDTSKGLIEISLDVKNATNTVNNFVVLARYHYFDGIAFHRIVPGFVIQGGDPMETGTGEPGYMFADELPKAGQYKVGSLAMANSGPNTNGSQFFIVTGDAGASLQPLYSLFGQVTQGLDVVAAIDAAGIPGTQDGKPAEVVTIKSVTIKES
jgi:cyclophilin family peptidyl-prolyl cis-trans isomerase